MKKIMFSVLLIVAFSGIGLSQRNQQCRNAASEDVTHWGHIANDDIEKTPLRRLYGVVNGVYSKEAVEGALVEVFVDTGQSLFPTSPSAKRIVTCITQKGGYFRFDKLKAGKYILAVGKRGFNITFIKFTLAPDSRPTNKRLIVGLEPGT